MWRPRVVKQTKLSEEIADFGPRWNEEWKWRCGAGRARSDIKGGSSQELDDEESLIPWRSLEIYSANNVAAWNDVK